MSSSDDESFEESHDTSEEPQLYFPDAPQFTIRAVIVGLLIGTLLTFTNMYFGLQTGWITMGSIQSAVVGFAVFRLIEKTIGKFSMPFTPFENVVLQTVSVATATMPLVAGFVGIIPALGLIKPPVSLSIAQQLLWSLALTYYGIFFAVPLRRQTILVEKLPFPSGTATAKIITLLHERIYDDISKSQLRSQWRSLLWSFAASFLFSLLSFFWPAFENWNVLTWIGFSASPNCQKVDYCQIASPTDWYWTLRPNLSYIGQGMIMGMRPALSMLGGAITAWGILGPLANYKGWVKGPINSWEDGAKGWVTWVSIGLMLSEALVSFAVIIVKQISNMLPTNCSVSSGADNKITEVESASPDQLVPTSWWLIGVVASIALCTAIVAPMFSIPAWQIVLSVLLSCLIAVISVRALGETDLNPVSGVGKLSQIIFAIVAPGHVVTNIVAGAIAEAGAMQAGELMQDLKTGHLLHTSPRAQLYAQLIGATFAVFITVLVYNIYENTYGIPSEKFQAPVAHVWVDMALLMSEGLGALPTTALKCTGLFACMGGVVALIESVCDSYNMMAATLLPSGMAWGVGMYLTADWTIPRVAGALIERAWRRWDPEHHNRHMLMVASGFVLGEGAMSIVGLVLTSLDVPTFG